MDYKSNNNKNDNLNDKITNAFNALVVNINSSIVLNKDNEAIV